MQRLFRRILYFLLALFTALIPCFGTPMGLAQSPTPQPAELKPLIQNQIKIGNESLFAIEADLGSFTAEERAIAINRRLKKTLTDPTFSSESIIFAPRQDIVEIYGDQTLLMVITEEDAKKAGKTREILAKKYVDILKQSVQRHRQFHGEQHLLYRSITAGILTLLLIIFLSLLRWLIPKLHQKILGSKGHRIKALRFQKLELLSEDQIAEGLILIVNVLKHPLIFGILYLYLLFVLSLFPWTQAIADTLLGYVTTAFNTIWMGFLDYLPNLVFIFVITFLTNYAIRFVKYVMSAIEHGLIGFPGFDVEWAKPTFQIMRFLLVATAITLAIPYLPGSSSPAVQGMSIFFGILVSLGSTAVAANVVSGLALTYTRAFKLGDRVRIADTVGDVVEKTFLVTQIRTPKNVVVTIPNSMILGDQIINYSAIEKDPGLILHTTVTLGYDVAWEKVHQVLIDSANATEGLLHKPQPFVLQKGLEDFYVSYELNAYTDQPSRMTKIYSDLHQNIQNLCNENDIEILSPHYSAVRDGNELTVPEKYKASNYKAPSFRVTGLNFFPNTDQNRNRQIKTEE